MPKEDHLNLITKALLTSGALDSVLIVTLEDALCGLLDDLSDLSELSFPSSTELVDYRDHLKNVEAIIQVARYFSTKSYVKEEVELGTYKKHYEELTKDD